MDKNEFLSLSREYLTQVETAALFHVSIATLRKWRINGKLIPVKVGGRVLYRAEDISKFVNNRGGNSYEHK